MVIRALVLFVANALLRVVSLGARLVALLVLAKALGAADFGVFSLIMTTQIVAIMALGYEFNAFSRREIVTASDPSLQTRRMRDSLVLAAGSGLGAVPIAAGAALAGLYPPRLTVWVAAIIFLDLFSQEGIRILYALQRVVTANLVYFVRSSAWVAVLTTMFYFDPEILTIQSALVVWTIFSLAAVLLLGVSLRAYPWSTGPRFDRQWVWRGLAVATPFFISAVFINVLSYLPRYILFQLRGPTETGIFGLYTGIAAGIVNLLSTIVIPAGVTQAVYAYAQQGPREYGRRMQDLWRNSALITLAFSAGLMVAFPFLLPFVGTDQYPMDWLLLALVVGANAAQVATLIAQTALYARHQDKQIMAATVGTGLGSVGLQYALASAWGAHGLAAAMLISMAALAGLLLVIDRRSSPMGRRE